MYINDEAQRQLLPILAKPAVAPAGEVQQRAGSLLQMNPGQQVKAEIIANLPNSLYLARVAGELYQLEIPLNVSPGELLELLFVTAEPRITFQLLRQPETGASVQLSSLGKWLAEVAENAPQAGPVPEPLLEDPEQGAPMLADRLRDALVNSGLFYESHLAQWAAGGLPLAELLKEPQGKLSRAPARGEAADGGKEEAGGFADSSTVPLIKEQLLLLNSGVWSWKGAPWPGEEMEISIGKREAGEGRGGVEATLALELARLGGVTARLALGADGLSVDFVCRQEGSAEVLKEGGGAAAGGARLGRAAAEPDGGER